jgi:hypothetical protein
MASLVQQQKSRPRKGSLRKVALLGRGAQRERREAKVLTIDTKHSQTYGRDGGGGASSSASAGAVKAAADEDGSGGAGLGLNISDVTPRPSMDGFASRSGPSKSSELSASTRTQHHEDHREDHLHLLLHDHPDSESLVTSPTISYTSTTDEDDVLHIPAHAHGAPPPLRPPPPDLSHSSGSESYFVDVASGRAAAAAALAQHQHQQQLQQLQHHRRRSIQRAKSPLSYSGLSTTPLPAADADHDYSETEWWGWVVLVVTWFVFVTGMGSCLGVWSWAWDVGTTPYAPPELEDDPTLPVVGYYPALMILTCVMAWVWVVVAWVGMKYFRHAKISGD